MKMTDWQHEEAIRLVEEKTHHAVDSTRGRDDSDDDDSLDEFGTNVGRSPERVMSPYRDGRQFIEAADATAEMHSMRAAHSQELEGMRSQIAQMQAEHRAGAAPEGVECATLHLK